MEPVGLVFQVAGINHSYQATDESDIESMNLNCILLYNTVPDGIPGHTRLQRDSLRPPTQGFQSKHLCHRPSPSIVASALRMPGSSLSTSIACPLGWGVNFRVARGSVLDVA